MSSGLTTLSASRSPRALAWGYGFLTINNRFNGLLRDESSLFGAALETVKTVPHSSARLTPS